MRFLESSLNFSEHQSMTYYPNRLFLEALNLHEISKYTQLDDLGEEQRNRIQEIQNLDISDFTEADVREEIISPILRLLGYSAAHPIFNVTRERNIRFGDIFNFPDYRLLLWQKNFWVLEAKKPIRRNHFSGKHILQAFKYGAHPDIKAGLVALCDGRKFSVYDIDENLSEPVLHFKLNELSENFDKLRLLLSPWNVWFFEKRRALSSVANIFSSEVNFGRAEEFMGNVRQTLFALRPQIMANFRNLTTDEDRADWIRKQDADMIIGNVFYEWGNMSTYYSSSERLAELYLNGDFSIPQKMFPTKPKRINEFYLTRVLHFLLVLQQTGHKLLDNLPGFNFLPKEALTVSDGKSDLENIIFSWAHLCVTNFKTWPMVNILLNASYTAGRLATLFAISNAEYSSAAEQQHVSKRYYFGELEPIQRFASAQTSLIGMIANMADRLSVKFSNDHTVSDRDRFEGDYFKHASAVVTLKSFWKLEQNLLIKLDGNFRTLIKEKGISRLGLHPNPGIRFDELGNLALWFAQDFQHMGDFWITNYAEELAFLANTHSGSAKKLLGIDIKTHTDVAIDDETYANYFFLGETGLWRSIYDEYEK